MPPACLALAACNTTGNLASHPRNPPTPAVGDAASALASAAMPRRSARRRSRAARPARHRSQRRSRARQEAITAPAISAWPSSISAAPSRLHPRDAEAWLGLAASYDRLRRFDLADRAYAEAIKIVGATVEILNNQGYSYMLRGDYKRARAKLLLADRKDPGNKFVANNLQLLAESTTARQAGGVGRGAQHRHAAFVINNAPRKRRSPGLRRLGLSRASCRVKMLAPACRLDIVRLMTVS